MTFADSYQFTCPADENAERKEKIFDLSQVTIAYCESFCMNRGCKDKDSCKAYISAKIQEGKYEAKISLQEQRQPQMETDEKDDSGVGEIDAVKS